MNGEEPWLGHDPASRAAHTGATARLWPDAEHPDGLPIELPLARLPDSWAPYKPSSFLS
ncbi:hypothetical protein [Streptomyces sp. NPDC002952]|uniref:hypothetical protein n=1 Tax=Streptomyces sp. NPDC002952 TaxID=3364673 RepID=UPI00368ABE00